MFSQSEIIEMAIAVGCTGNEARAWERTLTEFAKLVAAKEREACAKVCEDLAELSRISDTDSMWEWGECAAGIRARGVV